MPIKTIGRSLWNRLTKVGHVEYDGFVEVNGLRFTSLRTMFNGNPPDIQFGLYGDCRFTSNTIREFKC